MLIKRANDIRSSEITPEPLYRNRRAFIRTAGAVAAGLAVGSIMEQPLKRLSALEQQDWKPKQKGPFDTDEKLTPYKDITTYNNFYEFGVDKDDPAENAQNFKTKPWSVKVEGLVKKPAVYNLEDLLKGITLEDRIYRMRCVEAWSMVIPWLGFPLSELFKKFEPLPKAKFVEFTTLLDPKQMVGQQRPYLNWPYLEGLRMDEAMHPLAIFAVGLYGKELPNQNGAPLRLVVPWKYGFKGIKTIVKIRFVENQPVSTWTQANSDEYGFYSNVNPNVDHPRWSQSSERRIGEFFKRKTLMFNGYGEYVEHLYAGMDLKKYY